MARNYSSSEVRAFQREYQELYAKFRQLDSLAEQCLTQINTATGKIASGGSNEILQTIPVDELSRYRKGLRVKSLHDAGLHTVADVMRANLYQISAI
ncbi:MAG: hypothetical protein IJ171_06060, partial [Ruminococcus sp.]|nr:hypothetical protein [Ruminococcus sp.]